MAQKFTVPVTIKNLSSAGSDGLTVFLDQESFARLKVEAGGRITWGDGAGAGDTNLYRDAASVLKTDDTFKSAGLYVAGTQIDPTGATVGDALVFNGTKFVSASVASGSGNASLTVSDTPPVGAEAGDLWFESDTGKTFVYYDSFWVEVGSGGSTSTPEYLSGLNDVAFSTLANGDFLRYNGSASVWTNDATVGLGELSGISLVAPIEEYQVIQYDGTVWTNEYPDTVSYVRNVDSVTLTPGMVVYIFGGNGDHATVKRADNSSDTTSSKTLGVVAATITAGNNGPVVTRGYVDSIDLDPGYTEGDVLWLGKNGAFTTTKPSAPDHLVYIGVVVRATNNGIVYVACQNGYELEELHDVKITGVSDGQFLRYNSASTVWVNDTINLGTDTAGDYVQSLTAGTGVTLTNNSGEGATPTVAIGQAVGTSSSVQFAGIRNTDFSNFGSNTFTKATVGAGEIAIDNGTTDTPGLLMYHANNNNWGIDSSQINGSQSLRFVTNLNETGGTVRASIDASGNMVAATFRGTAAGSVLKDTMLDNSEVTVVSTTAGATGSMVNFITYSYTPVSSSSYLIVHIHISKYTMAGTTDDSWYSQINVDGSEIAYGWQMVNDNGTGTSGRSGVLFPLTGRYTNSNTTAKTIGIAARRDAADDSITIDNSSTAIWLRITEVAR